MAAPSATAAAPAAASEAPLPLVERRGSPEGPVPYLVVEPAAATDDLPLVVALHGRGDTAEGFARFARELRLPARVLVARAPLDFGRGKQWFEKGAPDAEAQVLARAADIAALARELRTRYPKAPKPLLVGFSQGAMIALQSLALHPDLFAGAAALSGFLPVDRDLPKAPPARPVLLTAGTRDTLVPPEKTRAAARTLEALGHAPKLFEFDGPHAVPARVREEVRAFLLERFGSAR